MEANHASKTFVRIDILDIIKLIIESRSGSCHISLPVICNHVLNVSLALGRGAVLVGEGGVGLFNKWWWLWDLLEKDVSLNEPWKPDLGFVGKELLSRNGENSYRARQYLIQKLEMSTVLTVNFFESELSGFADETEDHDPSN